MSKKSILILLLAVFLFSFLLRLSLISRGPYHSDCLLLAVQSHNIVTTKQMHYLQSSGLPLTALTGALFVGLGQILSVTDPVIAVNFMSVLLSSLCVVLLYLCIALYLDKVTAIAAAVLFSISPFCLGLSVFGNSHIPATFFLLAAIYFLLRFPRDTKNSTLLLAGISLGCLGAARIQDLVVMTIPLLFLMLMQAMNLKEHSPNQSKRLAVKYFIVPSVVTFVIVLIAYLPRSLGGGAGAGTFSISEFIHYHLTGHFKSVSFIAYINKLKYIFSVFSPIEWVFMGGGLLMLIIRKRMQLLIFLLLWLSVPFILYGFLNFFVYRFLMISIMPLTVLTGYGWSQVYRKNKWMGVVALCFLMTGVMVNLNKHYATFSFRHHHALLPDFFKWIALNTEKNALIIERDHSLWISYYAKRTPFAPGDRFNQLTHEQVREFKGELDGLLDQGIPVYVTKYGLLDRHDIFRKFMITHYELELVGSKKIEDWHLGFMEHVVVTNDLLRIKKGGE